jgi:hypothetical protein
MHSKIKKVKKDLEKAEKDTKTLLKADIKMDKKMEKLEKRKK